MAFKKQPAGTQRDLVYQFRVRPHFKDRVEEKLEWLRKYPGWDTATVSDVIRLAMEQYLKDDRDPRAP